MPRIVIFRSHRCRSSAVSFAKSPLDALRATAHLIVVLAMLAIPALQAFAAPAPKAALPQQAAAPPDRAAGADPVIAAPLGELVPGIACRSDPSQTYTLYLPTRYKPSGSSPVLFIFDPRGRSVMAAEIFRDAAERYGWILMSSDNTRSDGPWEPNFKAVGAMGPDASRYAIDPDRIYATGFSGGAMLAWIWAQQTRAVAGVIASGGRPVQPTASETEVPFAFFGAAGDAEFNYLPTRELDEAAARLGAPHRFESFPGPHAWMPAELALEAVEWLELQAMRAGKRPIDPELVEVLYVKDLEAARGLEAAGDALGAQRRYDTIARTFEGLRPIEEVAARAAELGRSPEVGKALERERAAHAYENARRDQTGRAIGLFQARSGASSRSRPMSVVELEAELRLPALLDAAGESTPMGLAARRVLNSLGAQMGFYLPRDYLAARDYSRAVVVLEIATKIGPPNPFVLYNLASARARLGQRKRAVEALQQAVAAGYSNVEYLEQDPDLENLRKLPSYLALIARMRSPAAPRS